VTTFCKHVRGIAEGETRGIEAAPSRCHVTRMPWRLSLELPLQVKYKKANQMDIGRRCLRPNGTGYDLPLSIIPLLSSWCKQQHSQTGRFDRSRNMEHMEELTWYRRHRSRRAIGSGA
jgi:hypothetical protein